MSISRSRERVTAVLDAFKRAYDSFPVRQTSVSVGADAYERAAEGCRRCVVDVTVTVRNGEDVLVVDDDGKPTGSIATDDESIEAGARRLVENLTGISCRIVDLVSVDIVDIHDSSDRDRGPVYRIAAVFEAVYEGGRLRECAEWRAAVPQMIAV